jgi:hypothetical protein
MFMGQLYNIIGYFRAVITHKYIHFTLLSVFLHKSFIFKTQCIKLKPDCQDSIDNDGRGEEKIILYLLRVYALNNTLTGYKSRLLVNGRHPHPINGGG